MRVTIRVDAGFQIGGGHAMRCLTLADALAEQGAAVAFITAAMPHAIEERIRRNGHLLERIISSPDIERTGLDWHERPLSRDAQAADVEATSKCFGACDWLIIDHYLLDSEWHALARGFARRVLVIDDMANRSCDCDLLLDQTFGRREGDYRPFVPDHATILAGSCYTLLRPEFPCERPASLSRRSGAHAVERILVSLGTTDPQGLSADIVHRILQLAPGRALDVVIAPGAPSLPRLQEMAARNEEVHVHVGTDRMAQLMRDADLSVGAAGTTSWERCCLGLPGIAFILADNQRFIAKALASTGAHIALTRDDNEGFAASMGLLLTSPEARARMSAKAAKVTDGTGTGRVLAAIQTLDGHALCYRGRVDD